ncbi:MAG TPA: molybdate ABC transporter substrate-binding protein [Gaiellaceae bacterium]|nr:molybdate ABC transporter substrate-binding protein [Gaiellaceae bacterium]
MTALAQVVLQVFAAASLTNVFPRIDGTARYQFGGSNTLAAQITQGAPADVFASANTTLAWQLYAKRLVTKPVVFTRNNLVLIVPRSNPARIHSVTDLRKPDVKLVVAAPAVPAGSYTLQVLKSLKLTDVLDNVVSQEPDVRGVLAKVALGEADAGFVYSTDARTVAKKVRTVPIPGWAKPTVAYAVSVVTASKHRAAAQAWVKRLLGKRSQAKLLQAGFLPRPGR